MLRALWRQRGGGDITGSGSRGVGVGTTFVAVAPKDSKACLIFAAQSKISKKSKRIYQPVFEEFFKEVLKLHAKRFKRLRWTFETNHQLLFGRRHPFARKKEKHSKMDNLVPHLTFLRSAAEAVPYGNTLTEQLEKKTGLVR